MKKQIVVALIIVGLLVLPSQILAQSLPQIPNPVNFPDFESIVNFLLGLIRPLVLLTLIATLMYGGFVYLTAQDDDAKVANAKKIMTAAIVGFIIIVLAPVAVQFVGALLGVRQGFLEVGI